MNKDGLLERLRDAPRSGVYRASRPEVIEEAAAGCGLDVARISFQNVRGKDGVLKRLAEALEFPAWFGGNWDALEDCLGDLSWREAPGHVLVLEGQERLSADDRGLLIDILASSAEYWAGRGRPFFAVFIDPTGALGLPDFYSDS